MSSIVPAIIPTSLADLNEKLVRLVGLTDAVQIDVVDGRFATPASWPYLQGTKEVASIATEEFMLPQYEQFRFEIDLMVENPQKAIGSWIDAGATRITIHVESTHSLVKLFEYVKVNYGHDRDFTPDLLAIGLALNIDTDPAIIEPHIQDINYIQLMGIARIGKQGEPFDKRVLQKIAALHKKYPNIPIQIDGGVTSASIADLLSVGVSRLIVGSDIWHAPDIGQEIKKLEAFTEEYGTLN